MTGRLLSVPAALAGLGLVGLGARFEAHAGGAGATGAAAFVWRWYGVELGSLEREALLRATDPPALAWILGAAALALVLGALAGASLGWRFEASARGRWLFGAGTAGALWLALGPGLLAFVARRDVLGAEHYLDVEDALRGLGVALLGLAALPFVLGDGRERDASKEGPSVALAALVAALVPALLSRAALDGAPLTNDGVAYRWQAELLARGELAAHPGPLADFFPARQFAEADGRVFGKYPPGHPAALAVGTALGRPDLLPRLLAALAVLLTWRVALRLDVERPVAAAWLVALSPMVLGVESLWLAHATSLPMALAFAWCALVAWDRIEDGEGLLLPALGAGLFLSLCFLARPLTAVAVGVPFLLRLLWLRPERTLSLLAWTLVGALPAAAWFLHVNRAQTGDAFLTAYGHYANTVSPNDRWGLVNLGTAWPYTQYNLARLGTWLHGAGLSLLLPLLGLACGAPLRHRPLLWGVPLALLAFHALHRFQGIPWVGPLYLVEGVPFLALLSAQGLSVLQRGAGRGAVGAVALALVAGTALLLASHLRVARDAAAERAAPVAAARSEGAEHGLLFVRLEGPAAWKLFPLPMPPGDVAELRARAARELVLARDLGERNAQLRAALGNPPAWLYVPATGVLLRYAD